MPVVLFRVNVTSDGNERLVPETSWYHCANVASLWMEVLVASRLGVPSAVRVSETADAVRPAGPGWSSPPMSSSWKSGLIPGAQFEAPWIRTPDASLAVPYSKSRTVPVSCTVLGTSAVTVMSDVAARAAGAERPEAMTARTPRMAVRHRRAGPGMLPPTSNGSLRRMPIRERGSRATLWRHCLARQ